MAIEVNQKGFTLVEMLVVVAIMAVLVMITVPQYTSFRSRAYISSCAADLNHLRSGLEAYKVEREQYPGALELR
ncbi:type IV pilin protein [Geomonas sp.]|uniref:type IV pilin protein n=1 Tax=Geomonas sp. TaxID=2651584 RepID=UPI002B497BEF|nr:prepilin-type N-terminal cleavage/methylation domain-containing protein [Geomonas sp.]HJV34386.1 prepilin-type N-terminal cleavage/methylation domain-containing protein [Geomonas sp.]